MTSIKLTDEQQKVLQAERGKPVDVVDPGTQERYVLLGHEQYERVRALLEGSPAQSLASAPPVGGASTEAQPPRVRLRALATPPELAADVNHWCKKYGGPGKRSRQEIEDQLKLQYYFGGQAIYVVRTAEGPVVVPIPKHCQATPGLRYILLTPEERSHAYHDVPSPWRDTESQILM